VRALAAISALSLSACALSARTSFQGPTCVVDAECGSGEVCFPDGCGDPGQNIVVEVTGNSTGLHAQDFKLAGPLRASESFDLRGPLILTGRLEKQAEGSGGVLDYTDGVSFSAVGKSDLLPGINRVYSLTLPRADQSLYSMFLGSGTFNVTARPADAAIPSERKMITARAGKLLGQPFEFKALDQRLVLTGTLVKTLGPPAKYLTGMSLQVFESAGGSPLSQPAVVQSNGSFDLYIHPDAAALSSITIVATPIDNTALVPSKNFVLSPVPSSQDMLPPFELGDFGDPLPMVSGKILSAQATPVAEATVTLEGSVGGGGSFRSRSVTTDMNGVFQVDMLPSAPGTAYTLTVIPPPLSSSGILQTQVRAGLDKNGMPTLMSPTGPDKRAEFTCPDRVPFGGTVYYPDGMPARGVKIEAVAVGALDMRPVPSSIATTFTDDFGTYQLLLDPARYRLDYLPGEFQLPRKSRFLRVEQPTEPDAGVRRDAYYLSIGRTVSGVVTVRPNMEDLPDGGVIPGVGTPAPNALVRFYRVTQIEGTDTSLLVGEGYTDERGSYSVSLPASGAMTR